MRSGEGMIIVPRWKSGRIGEHYEYSYQYRYESKVARYRGFISHQVSNFPGLTLWIKTPRPRVDCKTLSRSVSWRLP